ncbi:MAG: DUF1573 domain-containing protein [Bacteroidales bacterium]|nr:DUF1573 domain-containing protein [Bacteroidales bacterium]
MKRILVLITLIFAVNITLFSQEKTGAKISGGSYAQISFNEVEHDYGTIKKNSDGVCEFVYKNTGKAPLVITNVRSSCGCTVPSWSSEPLMPGQTGVIKVKYNTESTGEFVRTINVETNAANGNKGKVKLTVKGRVIYQSKD